MFKQQKVEKTQKSAEADCLKLLSLLNLFFYSVLSVIFLTPSSERSVWIERSGL